MKSSVMLCLRTLVFIFTFIQMGQLAAEPKVDKGGVKTISRDCMAALMGSTAGTALPEGYKEFKLQKGSVIPQMAECPSCGTYSFMPADFSGTGLLNYVVRDGQQRPGVSLGCQHCSSPITLWEVNPDTHQPISRAKLARQEVRREGKSAFVVLPAEYAPMIDPNNGYKAQLEKQLIHICPSCSTNTFVTTETNFAEHSCENCGTPLSREESYSPRDLLTKYIANRETVRTAHREEAKKPTTPPQTTVPDLPAKAESALKLHAKNWLLGGVAAVAVLSSAAYWANDTPIVAQGEVVSISQNMATVAFQELPYISSDRQLDYYQVTVVLDQRQSLPGELPYQVQVGDVVTIHYEWADFHILPMVFHPFTGAEWADGSLSMGRDIQNQ